MRIPFLRNRYTNGPRMGKKMTTINQIRLNARNLSLRLIMSVIAIIQRVIARTSSSVLIGLSIKFIFNNLFGLFSISVFSTTFSIRIVADCVALSCQVTRKLKRVTTLENTAISAIIFIHCYLLGFVFRHNIFNFGLQLR